MLHTPTKLSCVIHLFFSEHMSQFRHELTSPYKTKDISRMFFRAILSSFKFLLLERRQGFSVTMSGICLLECAYSMLLIRGQRIYGESCKGESERSCCERSLVNFVKSIGASMSSSRTSPTLLLDVDRWRRKIFMILLGFCSGVLIMVHESDDGPQMGVFKI